MLDQSAIREIRMLTDNNHHCEATQAGAMLVGATRLAEKAQLVAKIRDLDQGLDHNLAKYAYSLHCELWTRVDQLVETGKMTVDERIQLRSAY
jgi:hypothetical protein